MAFASLKRGGGAGFQWGALAGRPSSGTGFQTCSPVVRFIHSSTSTSFARRFIHLSVLNHLIFSIAAPAPLRQTNAAPPLPFPACAGFFFRRSPWYAPPLTWPIRHRRCGALVNFHAAKLRHGRPWNSKRRDFVHFKSASVSACKIGPSL